MRIAILAALLFAGTCFADETMRYQGETRSYIVHLPKNVASQGLPLVLAFHGGGGTAEGMERISGFDAVADANHFVVVYPQGLNKHWNDRREGQETSADDVGFIRELIGRMAMRYGTSIKRVYSTGLPNGGLFSYRLACELPGFITAIAPVAANQGLDLSKTCAPSRAVPILNIEGDSDPLIPFGGGDITGPFGLKKRGKVLSSDATVTFWKDKNGCTGEPTVRTLPAPGNSSTHVEIETYSACKQNSSVIRYRVLGGGHTWPGGEQYLSERLVGKTSRLFNASEMIWKFFQQFSL